MQCKLLQTIDAHQVKSIRIFHFNDEISREIALGTSTLKSLLFFMSHSQIEFPQKAAWGALLVAHAQITRKINAELKRNKQISIEVYDVLLALEDAPGNKMLMSSLAAQVVFSPSGLTRIIDRLETKGLVRREISRKDRRCSFAVITKAGLQLRANTWPRYSELLQEHFGSHLSSKQATDMSQALMGLLEDSHREALTAALTANIK